MVYYGIGAVFNIHNNYEGTQWNVLSDDEARSTLMWGRLTKDTDLEYTKTLISDNQADIIAFIRNNTDRWASDANLYQSTLTQLQMLRTDFKLRNEKEYNDADWRQVISDYYKAMNKHHGGP